MPFHSHNNDHDVARNDSARSSSHLVVDDADDDGYELDPDSRRQPSLPPNSRRPSSSAGGTGANGNGGAAASQISPSLQSWEKVDMTSDKEGTATAPQDWDTSTLQQAINLNLQGYPASDLHAFHDRAMQESIAAMVIICFVIGGLNFFHIHLGYSVGAVAIAAFALRKRIESVKADYAFDVERRRGAKALRSKHPGESVEWLNHIVKIVWPLINPDLFAAGVDLLEDTLKAQAPSAVQTVRIEDVVQGDNPFRLLSIKSLLDWPLARDPDLRDQNVTQTLPDRNINVGHHQPDKDGAFINIEVDYAYRRQPRASAKSNAHMLVYFGVGLGKKANVEIPVWVELRGMHGRIHIRLQMINEPPFFSNMTFTFPKLPAMEISARPLRSLNLMNLPLLSPYILSSVNLVLNGFVTPKAYSVDISRFLLSSDVVTKAKHAGVLVVTLHFASKLRPEASGVEKPNTFISISYGRMRHPLYRTRVVRHDIHPFFEETAFVMIGPDDLRHGERLRLTIWDSVPQNDRESGGDEVLGHVDIPMSDAMACVGRMASRRDRIHPATRKAPMFNGSLSWSHGYFGIAKKAPTEDVNKAIHLHTKAKERPLFSGRSRFQEGDAPSAMYAERMREMLDGKIPLNVNRRAGILVLQVHQMKHLTSPTRQPAAFGHVEHGLKNRVLPSPYCQAFINDAKVFETAEKKANAAPYYPGALYEHFCSDWTQTRIELAVLDGQGHGEDPFIGVVTLTLAQALAKTSQRTSWYQLTGGTGSGVMRVSLLFKTLDLSIPPPLRGPDIGTFEIIQAQAADLSQDGANELTVWMRKKRVQRVLSDSSSAHQEGGKHSITWSTAVRDVRIGVLHRRQEAICFAVGAAGQVTMPLGRAILWLDAIPVNVTADVELPLWEGEFERLHQNKYERLESHFTRLPKPQRPKNVARNPSSDRDDDVNPASSAASTPPIEAPFEEQPNRLKMGNLFPALPPANYWYRQDHHAVQHPDDDHHISFHHRHANLRQVGVLRLRVRVLPGVSKFHEAVLEHGHSDLNKAYRAWQHSAPASAPPPNMPTPTVHFSEDQLENQVNRELRPDGIDESTSPPFSTSSSRRSSFSDEERNFIATKSKKEKRLSMKWIKGSAKILGGGKSKSHGLSSHDERAE